MLDQLPEDQRELILHRLGQPRIDKIIAQLAVPQDDSEKRPEPKSKIHRGMPKERAELTRFYSACLREMGSLAKTRARERMPNPAQAWKQVYGARFEKGEPTFSHKMIAETVEYFGGWKQMWQEFSTVLEPTARGRFVMTYKELSNG